MRAAACLLVLALAGCGYHFAGQVVGLPDDVRSLSIGAVRNQSSEHGLEKSLAFALEREIQERGHFSIAADPAGGDAVLSGTIRNLRVRPVAFDANDQAVQYEVALSVDLTLTRQSDGRVLWRATNLEEVDEYSSSAAVVVTSSSRFQQGAVDAATVRNPAFQRVQLSETERRRAIDRLLQQAVRDIYNQMVEDF